MWTTSDDVANRWVGSDLPSDTTVITTLLGVAERRVLHEFPDLQDRIDDGQPSIEAVVDVVCAMVMRHLRNPTGTRTVQEGAGPFSASRTFGGNDPGAIAMTDDERSLLAAPGTSARKAFVIDLMPVAAE